MKAEQLYVQLLVDLKKDFPRAKLKPRSKVWWARLLDKTLLKKSPGRFTTTIFYTIAHPEDLEEWAPSSKYEILRHEMTHLRQAKRWGLGSVILGTLVYGFFYICVLPTVFTMRSRFEKEAYLQSAVADHRCGNTGEVYKKSFIKHMVRTFTGSNYLWMCPFKKHVRKWAEEAWEKAETIARMETT